MVHLESVMVFGYHDGIFCTCCRNRIRPVIRIKLFRSKKRDKILIAKIFMRAVGSDMVFVFRAVLSIHVAGVPFIPECRYAVQSPVDKNSEFCLCKPARDFKIRKGFPGVAETAAFDNGFYLGQVLVQVCDFKHKAPPFICMMV